MVINNNYFEILVKFQCTSYSLIVCTNTTNEYNNVIDNKCFGYKEKILEHLLFVLSMEKFC